MVLCLGLKFIPRQLCSPFFLKTSLNHSISHLSRRLELALYFKRPPHLVDSIPYNPYKSKWSPKRHYWSPILSKFITSVRTHALEQLNGTSILLTDTDKVLARTLIRLKRNKQIVIKPADKNLGLVVLDAPIYRDMCLSHLVDTNTYTAVPSYNPSDSYFRLRSILRQHGQLYKQSRSSTEPSLSKLAASLLQLEGRKELRIPPFYCIPKLHKGKITPLPSRPIISAPSSVTYHTSCYLSNELLPIIEKLPTVCTSSRHVIRDLHSLEVPDDHIILCADVTSLYPSIPIDFGLNAVRQILLRLNSFSPKRIDFLISLLSWVLHNNYCTFNGTIYLQIKGTAMGTPVAVAYANIVLYFIESPILSSLECSLYRRYIDDMFAALSRRHAIDFVRRFNATNPSIQLEAVTYELSGIFLDLDVSLVPSSRTGYSVFKHTLYQKPINKYQYIPPLSNHRPHVFFNFILQELKRYRLACTDDSSFEHLVVLFRDRLQRRGYAPQMLSTALHALPSRQTLLDLLLNPPPPTNDATPTPPIIVLNLPTLRPNPNWRTVFSLSLTITDLPEFKQAYGESNIVIGHRNAPSIARYITSSSYSTNNSIPST